MHPARSGWTSSSRGRHRPLGPAAVALTRTQIDREDLGITFTPMEGGGYLIGKTVKIEIELEAVRQTS